MNKPENVVVGIVGAGAMGQGIAQICALAGHEVFLTDIDAEAGARAVAAIEAVLDKLSSKGKLSREVAGRALQRVRTVSAITELAPCGLVIEAIVERLDVKRALLAQLEEVVRDDAILASNTSSLSITAVGASCRRPERIAGFHFFNPVPLMKVVEVVHGLKTSDETVASLASLAVRLGHTPVLCRDMPGFVVNHAGRALNTEGLRIVQEGVTDEHTVDLIVREQMGFRMGPFELLDLTGLDVSHPVMESIYRQFYDEPRFRPSPITANRLAGGLLGRKSGSGFYEYENGAKVEASSTCEAHTVRGETPAIWISRQYPDEAECVRALLERTNFRIDEGPVPSDDALIVVTPLGLDTTSCALAESLDASRVVAIDTLHGLQSNVRRVIMPTPATRLDKVLQAQAVFGADGTAVSVIRDSGGFVSQRIVACIVNTACEIAQQRIASPEHIDSAVRLGLGYPHGPLALGERLGTRRILAVLNGLMAVYNDPRYRPGVWLSRRALLNLPLMRAD